MPQWVHQRENAGRQDGSGLLRALLQFQTGQKVLRQWQSSPLSNEGIARPRTVHGTVLRRQNVDGRTVLHADRRAHDVLAGLGCQVDRHAGQGSVGKAGDKSLSSASHRRSRRKGGGPRTAPLRSALRRHGCGERNRPSGRNGKLRHCATPATAICTVRGGGLPRGLLRNFTGRSVRSVPAVHLHGRGDHPQRAALDVRLRYFQSDVQCVGSSLGHAIEGVQQTQILGEFASHLYVWRT
mmetsp:Transcript_24226/g.51379  ORF Transcript_24226/g.51379 Transcript_24226/m.51379 type:complete len:239 (+) Transcript_24226:726-1442(+)